MTPGGEGGLFVGGGMLCEIIASARGYDYLIERERWDRWVVQRVDRKTATVIEETVVSDERTARTVCRFLAKQSRLFGDRYYV